MELHNNSPQLSYTFDAIKYTVVFKPMKCYVYCKNHEYQVCQQVLGVLGHADETVSVVRLTI
jgi:hypothetical protein